MNLYKKYFLPLCILFGCFIVPAKSFSFDYKTYAKERHQLRSLTPPDTLTTATESSSETKKSKSSIIKEFTSKLLEALDSDLVPVKIFKTSKGFSIYLKPAKISKIGFKYKF